MENKKITVQFLSDNKETVSIKCLKVFSEKQLNKIRDRMSLIKEGGILYPSKFAKEINKNSVFVSKDGKIINSKNDSLYIIETTSKTIKETKNCSDVKIFSERCKCEETKVEEIISVEKVKEESIKQEQPIQSVKCECEKQEQKMAWKEAKERSIGSLKKAEQARSEATEAEAKIETVTIEKEEPKIVQEQVHDILPTIEIKAQPIPSEDEKLNSALTSVLESIQRKAETHQEQKPKEETEVEKLRLELMRKKLELIELWMSHNKSE
jgi:hypothetical protein